MTKEDYVSFETAKLLKEKGFVVDNITILVSNDNNHFVSGNSGYDFLLQNGYEVYPAPTLQMAMKWLREVHNIALNVCYLVGMWSYSVYRTDVSISGYNSENFDTYEKACEDGIKFCLENLI